MFKMYTTQNKAGSTAEFWDDRWGSSSLSSHLDQVAHICENDPLWALMNRVAQPNRLFMDGGCGPAHWVKYFHDRGIPSLGIDFASQTVERLNQAAPDLDIRHGDVRSLPLDPGSVHVYYSGGVVEHFEDGPEPALAEARRVVASDGWFLCSVPDATWLRESVLYRKASSDHMVVRSDLAIRRIPSPKREAAPDGWEFFQYAFSHDEFCGFLDRAGFQVTETFAYSLLWGLFELPGLRRSYESVLKAIRMARRLRGGKVSTGATAPAPENANGNSHSSGVSMIVRRAILREDPTVPVLGPIVRFAKENSANMRMYVCQPR